LDPRCSGEFLANYKKQSTVLGIIIARGGSKGLPRKNVLALAGKPLIAYTIEAALQARKIDRLIVSTDDVEIAEVSRQYGAEVPFMRPAELAGDDATVFPVLKHAMAWLQDHHGYVADYVLLLQATSPLRRPDDIDGSIAVAEREEADSLISVYPIVHPDGIIRLTEDGRIHDFDNQARQITRRQNVSPAYMINGAIYLMKWSLLLESDSFIGERTYVYAMSAERSLDIDTASELHLADLILRDENCNGRE